jgi:translation initiation factor IF-3
MSYKIDEHDFDVRVRAASKFVSNGDRVKITVQFKGRENHFANLGQDLLLRFGKAVSDVATMESLPKMEGRSFTLMLCPKKKQ